MIFELHICTVSDQQLDELGCVVVARHQGCKVEGGLPKLRLNLIDN